MPDTRTKTHCRDIVVGPNFGVTATGDLTLLAGRRIALDNGTSVAPDGALTLGIDLDLQIAKKVFATSTTYTGSLGGLSGAHSECNARATAAGLSGSFKAWLSDSVAGPQDTFARAQVPYPRVPFYRVDGVRIADHWTDLTDGTTQAPIGLDESGDPAPFLVWTSTLTDGSPNPLGETCTNWTSTTGNGSYGVSGQAPFWTDALGELACTVEAALYCFEQ